MQKSWGGHNLAMPDKCSGASIQNVAVTFKVDATTTWGGVYFLFPFLFDLIKLIVACPENIYIAGSIDALANWSSEKALPLSSSDYPTWSRKWLEKSIPFPTLTML